MSVRIHLAADIFLKHGLGEKELDKLLGGVVDSHEEAHEDFCHAASHCIEYLYTNIIRDTQITKGDFSCQIQAELCDTRCKVEGPAE